MNFDPMKIPWSLLGLFIVFCIGMFIRGFVPKITARVGKRIGIRIYQPWFDYVKNFSIQTSITHGYMFYLGPVFRLTGGIGMVLFMPLIHGSWYFSNFAFAGDMVLFLYLMFFGTLGMALGAGESGHPYSAIGVARGLAQVTVAEIPLVLAMLAVAAQHHTLSISQIVAAQQGGIAHWTMVTNPVATATGMLALLGSMMNSPFNVVLAPQEIPIGPPTEYHGTFLGILTTNRSIFPMAKIIFFMNIFFGGATNWAILILKGWLIYMWPVIVGVVFPRFRVDQSIRWFLKVPLLLGILAVALV
ncbi:NADH-quinone oxidoreductase subunit H [Myxococcota bacterium]|nr:NADH-quinone oxidoreductase subunit H [Myxococcota bacterium]MBU1535840.1 NADH-quinone oxidoreductase subunit H [Myxococcota bacterium]